MTLVNKNPGAVGSTSGTDLLHIRTGYPELPTSARAGVQSPLDTLPRDRQNASCL